MRRLLDFRAELLQSDHARHENRRENGRDRHHDVVGNRVQRIQNVQILVMVDERQRMDVRQNAVAENRDDAR